MKKIKITDGNVNILKVGDRVEFKWSGSQYSGVLSADPSYPLSYRASGIWVTTNGGCVGGDIGNLYKVIDKRTLRDLEVGDLLSEDGGYRKVLGICGEVVLLSEFVSDLDNDDLDTFCSEGSRTFTELEDEDFTIYEPEDETVEMTIKEVEEKLGKKPGTVRIKKED